MKTKPRKPRVQKSIKLDEEDANAVLQIAEEEVRDFSKQIELWIKEKLVERRREAEQMKAKILQERRDKIEPPEH